MKKLILALFLALILFPSLAFAAADITFEWDSNTDVDICYYIFYRSNDNQQTWNRISPEPIMHTGTGTETWIDTNVPDGIHFWHVTAVDTSGFESESSNIVDSEPPAPPQNLFIKLVKRIIAWLSNLIKHWFA